MGLWWLPISQGWEVLAVSQAVIPLTSAYLCPNDHIGADSRRCACCGERNLLALARVLDRITTFASPSPSTSHSRYTPNESKNI